MFGNARMTTALLDQLTHQCSIVVTGNEFDCSSHSTMAAKSPTKAREGASKGSLAAPATLKFDKRFQERASRRAIRYGLPPSRARFAIKNKATHAKTSN